MAEDTSSSIPELCLPKVVDSRRPHTGQIFATLDDGVEFYKQYTKACRFTVRMGTIERAKDGTIRTQYALCNREGVWRKAVAPFTKSYAKKRKTTSCKAKCMARAIFQATTGGYFIRTFNEGHSHSLVPGPAQHFMPSNRNVGEIQQMLIMSGIKANIGPMRTFRMVREMVGSYKGVGCTSTDFKNYVRDLKVYNKDSDAHMLLEALSNKKALGRGFKYFYDEDGDQKLRRLIWADESSVKNFELFGEAMSFDATYNTNRYKLIFTPFTGRDNYGKCISFGAALISREDTESYSWVLDKFVEIMGHAPRLVITDQDPALKKAVASSWKDTRHRYCMWHISMKVAEKVPIRLRDDPDYKSKFENIIWSDHEDPDVFEENWNNMIDEYDLSDNRWFSDMFEDRMYWVPAYFRDVSMSGLFRTTSCSESENSFFKRFINKNSDLVLLYTNYGSAIDAQRNNYLQMMHADETRTPSMVTNLSIEQDAAIVYTNAIFKEVQEEIDMSIRGCSIRKMYSEGDDNLYLIEDKLSGQFTVRHIHPEDYLTCTCNLFIRKGYLCRHMFLVIRNSQCDKIPQKYISVRWCKFSILCPSETQSELYNESSQNSSTEDFHFFKLVGEIIPHIKANEDLKEQFYADLIELKNKFSKIGTMEHASVAKKRRFEEFYGSAPTDSPSILPPDISKTKGSGVGDRRKSDQEKAMLLAQKPLRLCRKCQTKGHHDSRNCPSKDSTNR